AFAATDDSSFGFGAAGDLARIACGIVFARLADSAFMAPAGCPEWPGPTRRPELDGRPGGPCRLLVRWPRGRPIARRALALRPRHGQLDAARTFRAKAGGALRPC